MKGESITLGDHAILVNSFLRSIKLIKKSIFKKRPLMTSTADTIIRTSVRNRYAKSSVLVVLIQPISSSVNHRTFKIKNSTLKLKLL